MQGAFALRRVRESEAVTVYPRSVEVSLPAVSSPLSSCVCAGCSVAPAPALAPPPANGRQPPAALMPAACYPARVNVTTQHNPWLGDVLIHNSVT